VINRGTGTAIRTRFGIMGDLAGKSGTTQNNADAWFIAMHPNLVAGAWVGFNDNRVAMRSNYWGQGGHSAILLVGDFFKGVLASRKIDPDAEFPGYHKPVVAPPPAPEQDMEEGGDMQEGAPGDAPQPSDQDDSRSEPDQPADTQHGSEQQLHNDA
jgi:penicillin-binding protein 1A